jgi:polyisoprenoid-binding protein YceI
LEAANNVNGPRKEKKIVKGNGLVTASVARRGGVAASICLLWVGLAARASAQELVLRCDPAQTTASFTLGDVLHTVHGSFREKSGEIHFDPMSGTAGGEIVFDATSGQTGNATRDWKMHKEVLESARYPEISFRPDHGEGSVSVPGSSTVQLHGVFVIHGTEREMTVPVAVKLAADHWVASAHFQVPYVQWGLKNPSVLLLRVGDTVAIDLHAEGSLVSAGVR